MNRTFVRNNIASISIVIFICLFTFVQLLEPSFLYNKDGSLREFGIGKQKKTIIPIWFVSIVLAILAYLFVSYYLAIPKFKL